MMQIMNSFKGSKGMENKKYLYEEIQNTYFFEETRRG
jgi:hypothetical protein